MESLTLTVSPDDAGPVTLDQFKAQARIDATDQDAYLTALLKAATTYLDGKTGVLGRSLMTQTWVWRLDCWPHGGCFHVPLPPLQSVTSITYIDTAGATQTWASSNYQVDAYSTPGRIELASNATLPSLYGNGKINQVVVTFVAGYGATPQSVPAPIRHAISMLASHWYERRSPMEIMSGQRIDIPFAVDALIAPYRVHGFGR